MNCPALLCLGPQPTYPTARPGTLSVSSNLNQREAGRSHTASSAQGRGQRAFLPDGGTGALLPPPTPEVCWASAWGQARQQVCYSLRSCQRQASSLRQWLELSQEEPRPEDQEAEQQVQEELQEVRPWAAPGRLPGWLPGGASSQPAPSTSPGGSADPAAGLQVAGPAPAHPHLYRPHPCPAAGSVLVTTPRPGTECKTAASFFISKCCN